MSSTRNTSFTYTQKRRIPKASTSYPRTKSAGHSTPEPRKPITAPRRTPRVHTGPRPQSTPAPATATYPMRINRYLAQQGYATRKDADALIAAGKVLLNGTHAVLGDKVREHDEVQVLFRTQHTSFVYLAYNKPRGTVTHGAQGGEVEINDHIQKRDPALKVFPVGRLDKNSHGLILLTNDGRIVEPLLSPTRTHDKEYRVQVNERLRSDVAEKMSRGIDIGGYVTKPCEVERIDGHTFRIILTEGKNHQIKRMCAALGYTVRDLQRTRVMNVRLMRLRPNTYRHLTKSEQALLLRDLGL